MAKWEELSIADRAQYMKVAVENGYRDIRSIREAYNKYEEGGSIYIKPENRGKFTELKERTGHNTSWFIENGTPAQKKMAVFANNARKWKHEDGGIKRVRPNTSPTSKESTMLEDIVAQKIREDKNIRHEFDIPYIESKVMNIDGRDISTNALDSIAKYAGRTNTPLDEAVALGFESSYGRQPYFNYGQKGVSDRAIGNMNYYKNYGSIPAHLLVRDYEYTKGGYNNGKPYTNEIPLEHTFHFYKSGKYNTKLRQKDKTTGNILNHTQIVEREAKRLSQDKNYQEWKKNSGLKWYSGEAQKEKDRIYRHELYKKEHPLMSKIKDIFNIDYSEGGILSK